MAFPCPPYYSPVSVNNTPPCLPSCPQGLYTDEQYQIMLWVRVSLATIATIIALAAALPYTFMTKKWAFPGSALIVLFYCVATFNFMNLIPVMYGGKDHWYKLACRNTYTLTNMDDSGCATVSVIVYVSVMYNICMWFVVCLTLPIKILQVKLTSRTQFLLAIGISSVIVWTGVIIMLATRSVTGQPISGGMCAFDGSTGNGWYYAVTSPIPVLLMLVLGMIAVAFPMIYVPCRVAGGTGGSAFLFSFYRSQWRSLVLIFMFFFPAINGNGYWIYSKMNADAFTASIGGWYGCLYQTWGGLVKNGTDFAIANQMTITSCGTPFMPAFGPLLYITISSFICPPIFCTVFLIDKEVVTWYKTLFTSRKLYQPDSSMDQSGSIMSSSTASGI